MYKNGLHAPLCCTIVPFEQNQEVSGAQNLGEQKWDVSAGGRRSEQGLCKRPVQSKSCLCKSRRCLCKSFRVQITCEATAVRPCGWLLCHFRSGKWHQYLHHRCNNLTISSPLLYQCNNIFTIAVTMYRCTIIYFRCLERKCNFQSASSLVHVRPK